MFLQVVLELKSFRALAALKLSQLLALFVGYEVPLKSIDVGKSLEADVAGLKGGWRIGGL